MTGDRAGPEEAARAVEAARAAERGLAHDLRNLLTAIDGHAQLARAALDDTHPASADLDEVLAATSRAHQLAEAWMAGSTGSPGPAAPTPLDDLVRGFLPLLAAVSGDGIRTELHLAAPTPVRVSRIGLERVLLNLVLNARDAMKGVGTIAIAARTRSDGWAEVAVTDAGGGIDPGILDDLRRADGRRSTGANDGGPDRRRAGGHGLGLATSRALLVEAGGRLEADVTPGTGTTMRAVLPPARG